MNSILARRRALFPGLVASSCFVEVCWAYSVGISGTAFTMWAYSDTGVWDPQRMSSSRLYRLTLPRVLRLLLSACRAANPSQPTTLLNPMSGLSRRLIPMVH